LVTVLTAVMRAGRELSEPSIRRIRIVLGGRLSAAAAKRGNDHKIRVAASGDASMNHFCG